MKERALWFLLGAGVVLCLGAVAKERTDGPAGSYQMNCASYPSANFTHNCIVLDTRTGKLAWARQVPISSEPPETE